MKGFFILLIALFALACSAPEEKEYVWEDLPVRGEFLFEGPNTLQGKPGSPMVNISDELGVSGKAIKRVYVSGCQLEIKPDSMRSQVENALVQLVSDKLELVSVATINGIPGSGEINLEVSGEQNILPYLLDETTTLVVDANTKSDMDVLNCQVDFKLKILYTN